MINQAGKKLFIKTDFLECRYLKLKLMPTHKKNGGKMNWQN